ncbi:PAS domain-containing protein [Skermanella rosea]|uniref:sensor histidine kinase n=1 Tax=Skermanella rosea TaxID=1817965 RepID=UPI001932F7B2|nr:ATP-binding protein [Skermanella rosea]UEM04696.1 PAS domain-containing protein [Skermanella rosea]
MMVLPGSPLVRRLVIPVVFMFAVGAATIFGLASISASWQDKQAAAESRRMVEHALAEEKAALAVLAKDYTWWDEPITRLFIEFDADYADSDFGGYLIDQHGAAAVFVFNEGGAQIYSRTDDRFGGGAEGGQEIGADPDLRRMIREAMASGPTEPVVATGVLDLGGSLHVAAVSRFTPEMDSTDFAEPPPLGTLAILRRMDDRFLAQIGQTAHVHDFALLPPEAEKAGSLTAPLRSPVGNALATLSWIPPTPGRDFLNWFLPPLLVVGLIMGLLLALVLSRARQFAEHLASSEERLALALDAARDGLWDWNIETGEAHFSARWATMLGYRPDEIAPRTGAWESLVHPDDLPEVMQALAECRLGRSAVYEVEHRMRAKDGSWHWILARGRVVTRNAQGAARRMVGTHTDVTARRLAEQRALDACAEAEAASRVKSHFLANMSHELRTPLNAIIGFSDMLLREFFGPLTPKQKEYAAAINTSGSHLLEVIGDVLDLSKVEAGRMELHPETVDVSALVKSCAGLMASEADQGRVALETNLPPHPVEITADKVRLRQIILNLLSNAVKFTPTGGRVDVAVRLPAEGGLEISVRDTGVGMRPEDIRIALEPFRQLDDSMSRRHQGTGLGLPLAKMLAELHGGRLDLSSEPGRGTTVTVTLPAPKRRAALRSVSGRSA